ncbi:MAG: FecR domain-containing protein [Polyangiaceae bacterium]|nr:FecR domain-containing protein [Polyangiaceae bacterium]
MVELLGALSWCPRCLRVLLGLVTGVPLWCVLTGCQSSPPLVTTAADLEVVHPAVTVAGLEVRGARRLVGGDAVVTTDEGLARVRSDDGTVILIDRRTRLAVREGAVRLEAGRIYVQGVIGAHQELEVGEVVALVRGADVGVERDGGNARIYCAREEIVVRDRAGEHRVRSGETAAVTAGQVTVEPEKVFDDWTGGMAAPWAAGGEPRRALGELWGIATNSEAGAAGSPLTIRSHDVVATILGEVAQTKVTTTFFNGGSAPVAGDFRMALPAGALVSRFAYAEGGVEPRESSIAVARELLAGRVPSAPALEWAGEGWVRGSLKTIGPGSTVTVVVEYTEWLEPEVFGRNQVLEYRYPLSGVGEPPLIGEFSAKVDAGAAGALSIGAGTGAIVKGKTVVVRRSDFRAAADLVVDVEVPRYRAPARLYVAPALDDPAGDTVLLRTELPPAPADQGVTLAIVVDASASIDRALLGTARAVVAAILNGLGPRDRAVLLAADQTAHPLGMDAIGPVDPVRREALLAALDRTTPGGATDLGRALEAGADALPDDAPGGMVVYVGDGWPTIGDARVAEIESRLARRRAGAPRLAAVGVGPVANRSLLAALTRSSGPLLEVADASEAAATAVRLMVEALRPTYAGVEMELEPFVERIYPRRARAVLAGDTVSTVARVPRGRRPRELKLRWRAADGLHEEVRGLVEVSLPVAEDVRRRWAKARYDDVLLTGKGKEAAIDVAHRAGLLSPWTALTLDPSASFRGSRLETRLLDLSQVLTAAYAAPLSGAGALAGVPDDVEVAEPDDPRALQVAVAEATKRTIDAARVALRACRDTRAALRPELEGALRVKLGVDGEGRVDRVKVEPLSRTIDDATLTRCIEVVLGGLDYPACGIAGEVRVEHQIVFPAAVVPQQRKCSDLSRLPMPLRRGVWRERLDAGKAVETYVIAKARCELGTWTDRRAFLELVLDAMREGLTRLGVADQLALVGEADAADFLRRETVRRAASPAELREIRQQLLGSEAYPVGTFEKEYAAATTPDARLAVVRRFLEVAPHDARLRRRLVALLGAAPDHTVLFTEVRRVRDDPFADAGLLADAAEALKRAGNEAEARRTFGEITERAPADPWARAFLGDRLRNVGWYDDAIATGEALELLAPDEPSATLRLALAHEGAGRVDIARRMLLRLAQTGGRTGDAAFGKLANELSAILLDRALTETQDADEKQRLRTSLLELALTDTDAVLVIRSPAADVPVQAKLIPPAASERPERQATTLALGLGLYTLPFDAAGESGSKLVLKRRKGALPEAATRARVHTVIPGAAGALPRVATVEVTLPVDGKAVVVQWAELVPPVT